MRILLVTITALSLLLVGCNEAKKSRGTANARGTRNNTGGTPGGTSATLAALDCQAQDSWGLIYDAGGTIPWMTRVRLFASASVNYEDVGIVSGDMNSQSTGISFCGRVCASQRTSEIYIGIWDDLFVSPNPKYDSEIAINIKDGGNFGGVIESRSPPKFTDQFGYVIFQGAMSTTGGDATGTLVFRNNPNTVLGNIPQNERNLLSQDIPLGAFKIRADRLFRPGC